MCQLTDGDERRLKFWNFDTFLEVGFDEVGDVEEIRNDLTARARELPGLVSQGDADTIEEGGDDGIVLALSELTEEGILVGSLVAKEKNVHG